MSATPSMKVDVQEENKDNSAKLSMTECGLAVVIESVENDSEEIVTKKVPVVSSVRNIDKNLKVAIEEDIEEDVTSPDDNIIAGALKGSSSFSEATTIFKILKSLLKESIQLNVHETKNTWKTPPKSQKYSRRSPPPPSIAKSV